MSQRVKSVNVSTLSQLGTSNGEGQKVLLLHLLEGLRGMEQDWVEHGKVEESENKEMRKWEKMLQVKTRTVFQSESRNQWCQLIARYFTMGLVCFVFNLQRGSTSLAVLFNGILSIPWQLSAIQAVRK